MGRNSIYLIGRSKGRNRWSHVYLIEDDYWKSSIRATVLGGAAAFKALVVLSDVGRFGFEHIARHDGCRGTVGLRLGLQI